MNKKILFLILLISSLSLFINLYKKNSSPPCLNTDEAAFGYNAYSILKTGRDEYGNLLPLRLKSFGDYKMPLYTYLSVPFIAVGGLNEISTKALNSVISFIFPIVIFLLVRELFTKNSFALIAALLFSLTPAIQMIGRQAHEAYLTTFLITLSLWLLIKLINKCCNFNKLLFLISLVPLSFGYQFSRLWLGFFLLILIYFTFRKKISFKFLWIYVFIFFILLIPDVIIKPDRVNNLLFFNNIGLGLKTAELQSEGGIRLLYNKATVGIKNYIDNHLVYYSPQFLVTLGDENKRFNYTGISPVTVIEYLFLFIGLFYLFKEKQKWRFLLLFCLLLSPIAASLSWVGSSITRSLPLIIFINVICAYGVIKLSGNFTKNMFVVFVALTFFSYLFFCFYSWDFYFNHYSKRAQIIRAWQCGNREMANFIKDNYYNYDRFFITRKNGQPYIFLLYYLKFPPYKYQQQAQLSKADEFGFGQIEKFDKFNFQFRFDNTYRKTVFIGYPDDFSNIQLDNNKLKKIKVGTEEIFWIYKQD